MKMKEIFALLIRIIGVLGLAYVIRNTVNIVINGVPQPGILMLKEVAYLALGFYLVRGAPHLLKFAYPEEPRLPVDKPVNGIGAA